MLDELRTRLPDAHVVHAVGCDVNSIDRSGIDAAVGPRPTQDVAVLVVGDKAGLTEDCDIGREPRRRPLDLPGVQEELVLAVAATGKPVVLVIVGGRPMGSPEVHAARRRRADGLASRRAGRAAIADALVGAISPGGKLPVTWPRSSGQIPVFYAHKVSGGRSHWKGAYVDVSNEPLYPFGHGLTLLRVRGGRRVSAPAGRGVDAVVDVVATLTNTGPVRADEVVQLYTGTRSPRSPARSASFGRSLGSVSNPVAGRG